MFNIISKFSHILAASGLIELCSQSYPCSNCSNNIQENNNMIPNVGSQMGSNNLHGNNMGSGNLHGRISSSNNDTTV